MSNHEDHLKVDNAVAFDLRSPHPGVRVKELRVYQPLDPRDPRGTPGFTGLEVTFHDETKRSAGLTTGFRSHAFTLEENEKVETKMAFLHFNVIFFYFIKGDGRHAWQFGRSRDQPVVSKGSGFLAGFAGEIGTDDRIRDTVRPVWDKAGTG